MYIILSEYLSVSSLDIAQLAAVVQEAALSRFSINTKIITKIHLIITSKLNQKHDSDNKQGH